MLLDIYFLLLKMHDPGLPKSKKVLLRITESSQMILIKTVDMLDKNLFAKREIHVLRENYFSYI